MSGRSKHEVPGIAPRLTTLGDQVRAEALRRGGEWPSMADDCARQAECWYGKRPCKGEDLALVFGEIYRVE
ncbi:hypothetical protein [Paraburkholderia strydomiana]|uniref:hypothetical protein n=1 Tax=Paraburkholderia strydomiana TaxID=1245417 RepID=UPI001BEAC8F9|nr:hypothetical protein [Paraburkholderia strydomiana]MBT2789168.1 hypothetical protein [Paraburkholderia strydomiana]